MRKIVIFGGSGLLGKEITKTLLNGGYSVFIVSRDKYKAKSSMSSFVTEKTSISFLSSQEDILIIQAINSSDAVINLAGAGIFDKRWTKKYKEELFKSRIDTTKSIVDFISKAKVKPKVFISGSAVGYYGGNLNEKILDENSPSGFDFLALLCTAWENEANVAKKSGVKVINLRTGIILSTEGGALTKLIKSYKYRIGTYFRPGNQYLSWIHIEDLAHIVLTCIANKKLDGPVNATAPKPITHKKLSEDLFEIYQPLFTVPIPRTLARLVLGEGSTLLTTGQKVTPQKLLNLNFEFKYTEALQALKDLSNFTSRD